MQGERNDGRAIISYYNLSIMNIAHIAKGSHIPVARKAVLGSGQAILISCQYGCQHVCHMDGDMLFIWKLICCQCGCRYVVEYPAPATVERDICIEYYTISAHKVNVQNKENQSTKRMYETTNLENFQQTNFCQLKLFT